MVVIVAGQAATSNIAYDPPVVHAVAAPLLSTAGGNLLQVTGSGFADAAPARYASASLVRGVVTLPCLTETRNTTMLTCRTPVGFGVDWAVVVTNTEVGSGSPNPVSRTSTPSTTRVAFAPPTVTAVETMFGAAPALGGFTLHVAGTNLSATPIVLVGGTPCRDVFVSRDHTSRPVVAVTAGDQSSGDAVEFEYDAPVLTIALPSTLDAVTEPRGPLVLMGWNFGLPRVPSAPGGDSGALDVVSLSHTVLVGGRACGGTVWTSDNELSCVVQGEFPLGPVEVLVSVAPP